MRYAEGETPPPGGEPKLFVGMVSRSATEEELRGYFSPYGQVLDIHIIRKNGESQGACFVKYDSLDACDTAIGALDGKITMPGLTHPLNVKYAADPAKKREEQQWASQQSPLGLPATALALAQLQLV